MMEIAFLSVVLGGPLLMCLIALLGSHFHRGDDASLIDWKPTRSADLEARLRSSEVEQMLAAVNRYRRARGAAERSLEEITAARAEP
jgi:hypothetical protein